MWLTPEFYKTVSRIMAFARMHPYGDYLYSDLNLILTQQMLKAKTSKKLDELANEIYIQIEI